jgi:hypothetical protein
MKTMRTARGLRWGFLAALMVLGAACGPKGAIDLTIDGEGPNGPLVVPTDTDKLVLKVTDPDDDSEVASLEEALETGDSFPLSLGISAGKYDGDSIKIVATAMKGDVKVSEATATVPFDNKVIVQATLLLLPVTQ